MEKDKDFIRWYKKSMEHFKPAPPFDSWEEINRQLDIDEVWENLDANLNHIDKEEKYFRYTQYAERFIILSFFLLLVLPFIVPKLNDRLKSDSHIFATGENNYPKLWEKGVNKASASSNKEKEFIDAGGIESATAGVKKSDKNKQFKYGDFDNKDKQLANHESALTGKSDEITNKFSVVNGKDFSSEPAFEITLLNHYGEDLVYSHSSNIYIGSKIADKIKDEGSSESQKDDTIAKSNTVYKFAIGIHGAVKNHWLLNQTTYRGLSSEEPNTSLPSFGKSLGISAVFNLKPRMGLQAELVISEEGQAYKDYIHGHYTKKSINLTYYNFAAIFKYRLSPLIGFSRASNSSLLLGLYNSRLCKAEEIIEQKSQNVVNEYKPYDAGFLAGFEYEHVLSKRLAVTTGIRFKYGLTNIYAGNTMIPSSLNETKNGSVDITISFLFLIPKK